MLYLKCYVYDDHKCMCKSLLGHTPECAVIWLLKFTFTTGDIFLLPVTYFRNLKNLWDRPRQWDNRNSNVKWVSSSGKSTFLFVCFCSSFLSRVFRLTRKNTVVVPMKQCSYVSNDEFQTRVTYMCRNQDHMLPIIQYWLIKISGNEITVFHKSFLSKVISAVVFAYGNQ